MKIFRGDIFWAPTMDEHGNMRGIIHPQLVIQDTIINNSRIESIVMCEISTNMKKAYEVGNILLDAGEGNLDKRSIIIPSHISLVNKKDLGDFIGKLSPSRIDEVFSSLKLLDAFQHDVSPSV